jgi:hypothetical protein
MHNKLLLLSAMVLLAGCSSKEQELLMESYNKDKVYHKKLQKTEKVQLYDAQVTKAILTATYLFEQSSDKNDKRDEVFIVGVYVEDEEFSTLNNAGYNLTLNGTKFKSIKALKESDTLLKNISFVSDWSQFYLVKFPHTSSKSFKLIFESDMYGKGELNFAKVAKFVFSKEAF